MAAENNPAAVNPANGLLITAKNRTVPIDHPVHVTRSWMPPYRACRIRELLDKRANHTVDGVIEMQLDQKAIEAQIWIAALRRVRSELEQLDPYAWAIARDQLLDWDFRFSPDSSSAALFIQLRKALFGELFGDELGEDLDAYMQISMLA